MSVSPLLDLDIMIHYRSQNLAFWVTSMKPDNATLKCRDRKGSETVVGRTLIYRKKERARQINLLSLFHSINYAVIHVLLQTFWEKIHMLCELHVNFQFQIKLKICILYAYMIHCLLVSCCDAEVSMIMNFIVFLCFTSFFPISFLLHFLFPILFGAVFSKWSGRALTLASGCFLKDSS